MLITAWCKLVNMRPSKSVPSTPCKSVFSFFLFFFVNSFSSVIYCKLHVLFLTLYIHFSSTNKFHYLNKIVRDKFKLVWLKLYTLKRIEVNDRRIVRGVVSLFHGVLVKSAGSSLVAQFSATTRHRITWLTQFQTVKGCAVDRKN